MPSTRSQAFSLAAITVMIVLGGNLYLNLGAALPESDLNVPAIEQQVDAVRVEGQNLAFVIAGWLVLIGIATAALALTRGRQAAAGLALGLGYSVLALIAMSLAWRPLGTALFLPVALLAVALLCSVLRRRAVTRECAILAGVSVVALVSIRTLIWVL